MPNPPRPIGPKSSGTVDKVPCPFCGHPNDFRDVMKGHAGQALVDAGDSVTCDHCNGEMKIEAIREVTVIHVAQGRSPRARPGQPQPQRQQRLPQQKPGGFLQKLLGK